MLIIVWDAWQRLPKIGWLSDKHGWSGLASSLWSFVLAPIILPPLLVIALLCWLLERQARRVSRKLRKYQEYLFDPVEPDDLNAEVVAFFDEQTGPLESLQFRIIGDHWLWREPLPYVERHFISEDGRSFAAIGVAEEVRHVAFYSVLSDESYLETALAKYDDPETNTSNEPNGRLQTELHLAGTVDELFLRHEERLDRAMHEAICYEPDDVRSVSIYGSRLVGNQLYVEDLRDELPPPAEWPLPRSCSFSC